MKMLDVLERYEQLLPTLLENKESWQTLDIDYEPPHVERLWQATDDGYRICLHKIYPCEKALYHPHPWASAIKIYSGRYEMGIGVAFNKYGTNDLFEAAKVVLGPGDTYEMTQPEGWHYVKPLNVPSLSFMVMAPEWETQMFDHSNFGKGIKHNPLPDDRKNDLFLEFEEVLLKKKEKWY